MWKLVVVVNNKMGTTSGDAREGTTTLLHEAPVVHVSIGISGSARSAIRCLLGPVAVST